MSKIEVNQISSQCGSTLTIGQSGDTVTLACGATAAGFGSTGEVSWDTTKKTSGFTAVSGVGYFCDTTSAAFTVTLPASPSAGNVVAVSDYNGTAGTNNITVGRNSSNINGAAEDFTISKSNSSIQFIYIDATVGWQSVFTGNISDAQNPFIVATGGTETTCGDYKIHTFTGPGTFTVTSAGTPAGATTVDYLVVAGGGGGASNYAGGGGAGGYRESSGTASGCYTASPLGACVSALPISVTAYPITVGSGGAGGPSGPGSPPYQAYGNGTNGSNSVFSTITSTGGGFGLAFGPPSSGGPGGSGGGGTGIGPGSAPVTNGQNPGGTGNTPPVSPPQGQNGGLGDHDAVTMAIGGGGGGAGAAGTAAPIPGRGFAGTGGNGVTSCITGSPVARAGGGGGGQHPNASPTAPQPGGTGGGGAGAPLTPGANASNGTANTGGGGGGSSQEGASTGNGGTGGSGIVIIRYKYQ